MTQIVEYIINSRRSGVADDQIIQNLTQTGWQHDDITTAFSSANEIGIRSPNINKVNHKLLFSIALLISIVFIISAFLLYYVNANTKKQNPNNIAKSKSTITSTSQQQFSDILKDKPQNQPPSIIPSIATIASQKKFDDQDATLAKEIEDYLLVQESLEKAVSNINISALALIYLQYLEADSQLNRRFLISEGHIRAYLISKERQSNKNQEIENLTNQLLQKRVSYDTLRMQVNLNLALLFMDQNQDAKNSLIINFKDLRSDITSYQTLINQISPRIADFNLPGFIQVINHKTDPQIPQKNYPFKLNFVIRNVGKNKTDKTDIEFEIPDELSTTSPINYSYENFGADDEKEIEINLDTTQPYNGNITVNISTSDQQFDIIFIPLSIN